LGKNEVEKNLHFILKFTWISKNKDAIFAFRILLQLCSKFGKQKLIDIMEDLFRRIIEMSDFNC